MRGKFVPAATAETQKFDWGTFRWISKPPVTGTENLCVVHVTIEPGHGHAFHRHPNQEEVIHVLEGSLEQWLGEEKRTLEAGDSVFVPRNLVHASYVLGDETVKALAILGPAVGDEGYELVDVSDEAPWNTLRTAGS